MSNIFDEPISKKTKQMLKEFEERAKNGEFDHPTSPEILEKQRKSCVEFNKLKEISF